MSTTPAQPTIGLGFVVVETVLAPEPVLPDSFIAAPPQPKPPLAR